MAAPAELRDLAEKVVLAGVGAVALTAERVDALAEELSARGGIGREEARALIEELVGRWRSEGVRIGHRQTGVIAHHPHMRDGGETRREVGKAPGRQHQGIAAGNDHLPELRLLRDEIDPKSVYLGQAH